MTSSSFKHVRQPVPTSIIKGINTENLRWLVRGLFEVFARYYLGVITFILSMMAFVQFVYVGISVDHSLPDDHLYVVAKWSKNPSKNSKMAFRTSEGPFGPPAGLVVVKYIYGMPGDIVTTGGETGRDVFINGVRVAHAKPYSKTGKPLPLTTGGVIPQGMLYIGTPSKDSYDSRYATMGLVPFDRIVGQVVTLF